MRRTTTIVFAAGIVLALSAFGIARAVSDTVVDSTRLVDCAGTTDAGGYLRCTIPDYDPAAFIVRGVDPVLQGPFGGQRNLPSANIYVLDIDQAPGAPADSVLLRIIGTESIVWPHDGHIGPIPYRNGAVQLQLQLFLDAA
jgi:hypothetical protein